jgi:branched-chain amino acid transport system permease protein
MSPSITKGSTIIALAALVLAIALPLVAPGYYVQFAAKAMLMGMLALSLNLVVGYGGLVSLCHAAFFGFAGYMLAFLTPESAGASIWLSLPATLLAVGAVAAVIGILSLRTRGIYFIMVTLAFGEMLFYFFHDTKIGGGSDGMYIYFKPEIALGGLTLLDLESNRVFYYVVLACLVGSALLIRMLVQSPFGHALAAARDNERRALSLGYSVFRVRLTAFVVSAMIAGLAGYFSAAQFGFIAPQLLGLEEVLKSSVEHWKLVKGGVIIALVFLLPGGLQQLGAMLRRQHSDATPDLPAANPSPIKEAPTHA